MNNFAERIQALADEIRQEDGFQEGQLSACLDLLAVAYDTGMIAVAVVGLGRVTELAAELQDLGEALDGLPSNPDAAIVDLLNKKKN